MQSRWKLVVKIPFDFWDNNCKEGSLALIIWSDAFYIHQYKEERSDCLSDCLHIFNEILYTDS